MSLVLSDPIIKHYLGEWEPVVFLGQDILDFFIYTYVYGDDTYLIILIYLTNRWEQFPQQAGWNRS